MESPSKSPPKSMRTFYVIWIGQLISLIGSGLTGFGLGVWIYEQTGQATPLALNALFFTLPNLLVSPLAGSIVDRKSRRMIMILADIGAACVTLIVVGLIFADRLEVWHIYLTTAMSAVLNAFQEPAYRASITMLVPKKDLVRAAGIQQIGGAARMIMTPLLASVLYVAIGLRGVIVIDFLTFFFAVGALVMVHIPQPERVTMDEFSGEKDSYWADVVFGMKFLSARPGLVGLLMYYAVVNFFLIISGVLSTPLVLSFGEPTDIGLVQMAGGAAMLAGGMVMSTWGGPKKRLIWGVIAAIMLNGFGYLMMGLRPSTGLIAAANFVILFFIPISAALSQGVWQVKVPPDVQGRVFAIRGMIASSITPLATLLAGPLADRIFEPLMTADGRLGRSFLGTWIGVGPGRGIGLLYILSAFFLWLVSIIAFMNPRIRNLEEEIPDAVVDDLPVIVESPPEAAEESMPGRDAAQMLPID